MDYQKRFEKLLHAAQGEAICEHRLDLAKDDEERGIALVNLEAAREYRDTLLKRWGLFPVTA
jgi:hypothetical protein